MIDSIAIFVFSCHPNCNRIYRMAHRLHTDTPRLLLCAAPVRWLSILYLRMESRTLDVWVTCKERVRSTFKLRPQNNLHRPI